MGAVYSFPDRGVAVPDQPPNDDQKPQLSDGYTRIVNELMEAFASCHLSATELRLCFAIMRKTYGFRKAKDRISASQLGDLMDVTPQKASTTLGKLLAKNVVIREGSSQGPLKINTQTDSWIEPKKGVKAPTPSKDNRNCEGAGKNGNPNRKTVKNPNRKTVNTKERKKTTNSASQSMSVQSTGRSDESESPKPSEPSKPLKPGAAIQSKSGRKWGEQIDVELAEVMASAIDTRSGQDAPANRNMTDWANTIRLMRERDDRPAQAIRALIAWSQQHHFWHRNILSPDKLRKQWTRLAIERNEERKQREGGTHEARRTNTRSKRDPGLVKQQTDIEYAIDNF